MAMMERAMSLFAPFRAGQDPAEPGGEAARIAALQAEVERLRTELEAARRPHGKG
jgi:hypothetical protein